MARGLDAVVAGEGIDSLRANLSLLFERFEMARAPATDTHAKGQLAAVQAAEYDEDSSCYPMLAAGEWTVCMIPRSEWVRDLDGYWRELLGRVPLAINESLGTATD